MKNTSTLGTLYTISAPSGAGKTSLVQALLKQNERLRVSVSHTTRAKRPNEQNGINYHFVTEAEFVAKIEQDGFLEHAKVFTNYYGTSRNWVESTLTSGHDVILEIDWQGAQQIRSQIPDTVSIFILPPSTAVLKERLTRRGQDEPSIIDQRMAEAKSESSHFAEADYLVINDNFDTALTELRSILTAQQLILEKQQQKHNKLLEDILS